MIKTVWMIINIICAYNGQYVLDKESTEVLSIKINEMINSLLEKQEEYLQGYRIEGHVYKVDEKETDRAWLVDITNNSNEAIEEVNIPEEILSSISEGDKLKFEDGKYQILS